jgi:hypothetical protein
MLLTHRNVPTMLHRMRCLRLALICFGVLLGATLLPAQSVPDLKLVVTGERERSRKDATRARGPGRAGRRKIDL